MIVWLMVYESCRVSQISEMDHMWQMAWMTSYGKTFSMWTFKSEYMHIITKNRYTENFGESKCQFNDEMDSSKISIYRIFWSVIGNDSYFYLIADMLADGDKTVTTALENFIDDFDFSIGILESVVDIISVTVKISQFAMAITFLRGIGFTDFDRFVIIGASCWKYKHITYIFANRDKAINTDTFDVFIKNFDFCIRVLHSPFDEFDIVTKSVQVTQTISDWIWFTNFLWFQPMKSDWSKKRIIEIWFENRIDLKPCLVQVRYHFRIRQDIRCMVELVVVQDELVVVVQCL